MQNNQLELTVINNLSIVAQKQKAKRGKIWRFGLDGQIWTVFCKYFKLLYSDFIFGDVVIMSSSHI